MLLLVNEKNFVNLQVVRLASDTFNYTPFDRAKARSKKFATERFPDSLGKHVKAGLPPKVFTVVCQVFYFIVVTLFMILPLKPFVQYFSI